MVDRAPPPARVTLELIPAERVALYRYLPPPGEYGAGLPANCLPDGTQVVPKGEQEVTSEASEGANEGGQRIRSPTEGRPESEGVRGETEQVDLGGDVETCRR